MVPLLAEAFSDHRFQNCPLPMSLPHAPPSFLCGTYHSQRVVVLYLCLLSYSKGTQGMGTVYILLLL